MNNAPLPRTSALLTTEQAATILTLSPATLSTLRCRGGGPPFIKIGASRHGRVRYREADLLAWIESRAFHSTAGFPSDTNGNG
jgi:predicted DNA-binding transcriptional regulator AlpA